MSALAALRERIPPVLWPVIAAAIAHLSAFRNGFVWDDLVYIQRWGEAQKTVADTLFRLPEPSYEYYRPILFLSALTDRILWDTEPFGYHLTNFAWHLICVGLVFGLVRVLVPGDEGRKNLSAALAATLFGVFPFQVETVSWIFARNDLLACAFVTAGLLFTIRWADREVDGRRKGLSFPVGAALAFLGAMLSKETGILFVPLVALLILARYPTDARRRIRPAPLFGAILAGLAVYIVLRTVSDVSSGAIGRLLFSLSLSAVPELLSGLGHYAVSVVWPFRPAFVEQVAVTPLRLTLGGIVALGGPAGAFYLWARGRRLIAAGILWFLGGLVLPVMTVVNPPSITAVGDRHLYLPSIGLFLVAAVVLGQWLPERWRARQWPSAAIAGLALLFLPINAVVNKPWVNDLTYWENASRVAESSHVAWANYGAALGDAGRHEEAVDAWRRAVEDCEPPTPIYARTSAVSLALAHARVGQLAEARAALDHLTGPPEGRAYGDFLLVLAMLRWGEAGQPPNPLLARVARGLALRALSEHPNLAGAWFLVGEIDAARDEPVQAAQAWRRGVGIHVLGQEDSRAEIRQRRADALAQVEREPDPGRAAYFQAQLALETGGVERAEKLFGTAIDATWADPRPLIELARLYHFTNRSAQALQVLAVATEEFPDDVRVWRMLIQAHRSGSKPEAVEGALLRAVALEPGDAELHHALGFHYWNQDERERAIPYFETFMKTWRGDPRLQAEVHGLLQQVGG